jgi:hypothetical protein
VIVQKRNVELRLSLPPEAPFKMKDTGNTVKNVRSDDYEHQRLEYNILPAIGPLIAPALPHGFLIFAIELQNVRLC